jgi:hypothetical protein
MPFAFCRLDLSQLTIFASDLDQSNVCSRCIKQLYKNTDKKICAHHM